MRRIKILSPDEARLLDAIREIRQFEEYHATVVECIETYRHIAQIAKKWTS